MGLLLLRGILPSWVEADPLRGRAIDALGLQLTADKIAEELLPGISVLTNRARYYAVLAWARRACGSAVDEQLIHRLEVALASREALLHAGREDTCRYVGSQNLRGYSGKLPPDKPTLAYQSPVWRSYRASMRSLGLLDPSDALTSEGDALARQFARACKPKELSGKRMLPDGACLSRMSAAEGAIIESALGVWKKGKIPAEDTSPTSRRAATERELRTALRSQDSPEAILAAYERKAGDVSPRPVVALRRAATWERLSVGLQALFLLFLKNLDHQSAAERAIQSARKSPANGRLQLNSIEVDDNTALRAVQSIRRALKLRDELARDGICTFETDEAFELGEMAAKGTAPVSDFLNALEARHFMAKQDDAWIRTIGTKRELVRDSSHRWLLPTRANVRGYRIPAFSQLIVDLHEARKRKP